MAKKRICKNKRPANNKIKLSWEKMEVTRVRLNSDQAVLSCCETPGRGQVFTSGPLYQCFGLVCGVTSGASQAQSS